MTVLMLYSIVNGKDQPTTAVKDLAMLLLRLASATFSTLNIQKEALIVSGKYSVD